MWSVALTFWSTFRNHNVGMVAIYELLKPGGFALLEVPNFDYIASAGLISEFIADHLHYFFAEKFQQTSLRSSGFSIHQLILFSAITY